MLARMQSQVREFHEFFGLFGNQAPTQIPHERRSLRRSLIAEENSELWQAVSRFDMPNAADGIADLLYVTLGTRVECGLPPLPPIVLRPQTAIGFPEKEKLEKFKAVFARALSLLCLALERGDKLGEIDHHTAQVARNAAGLSAAFGLPLVPIFEEIHKSNMSKSERPAHFESCTMHGKGDDTSRCNCGAIKYREDGKLLKGALFQPPDITGILKAHGYTGPRIAERDNSGTMS